MQSRQQSFIRLAFFLVIVLFLSACGSSPEPTPEPQPTTQPGPTPEPEQTVEIVAGTQGSFQVKGENISLVKFYLNDTNFSDKPYSTDKEAPFELSLDTAPLLDGEHSLSIRAKVGDKMVSASTTFTIDKGDDKGEAKPTDPDPEPTPPTEPEPTLNWVKIADEKTSFTLAKTMTVRFGADTRWREKTMSAGTWQCQRSSFGEVDPAEGTVKRCEVLTDGSTPEPEPTEPTEPEPEPEPKPEPEPEPKPEPEPEPKPTPAPGLSGIGFLGDSNTELYYLAPQKKDYASLVAQTLKTRTRNYGEGGQTTRVYLGSERMKQWKAGAFAYYMITFGLNDARYVTPEQFKQDTLELIAEVRSIGAIPILVTNVHVDNKGGHYPWDYNTTIKTYDDMYRAVARENDVKLIDVNLVFKRMNDAYNAGDRSTVTLNGVNYQLWDTRIRNTPRGAPLVLDNSQDSGKDAIWFLNIHYNAYGAKIVGDQITKYFLDHEIEF